MSWNYGDILDGVDAVLAPDAPALIHGDDRVSWGEFAQRSNNLSAALCAGGAQPDDKVAFYLRNRPEYLIGLAACLKARLVHVNVNYRYLDDELHYLFDDSDAKVVLFEEGFAGRVERLRGRLPKVERWLQVGGAAPPAFAESFAALCSEGEGLPLTIERSPDDLLFVYTGGTTGLPKGVMWRNEDLWGALGFGTLAPANRYQPPESMVSHVENVKTHGPGPIQALASPLIHSQALLHAIDNLAAGGGVLTLAGESFDAEELFDAIERHRVKSVVIVGDAFARPMLNALDAHAGRWDLSSVRLVFSSGAMWSREIKEGLLRHYDGWRLVDFFGASEALSFGASVASARGATRTAEFELGDDCKVFTEDLREVKPGSGERGFIARSGPIPLGYYKDPEKTVKTFPRIDGVRYSVPGDWCTVEADGTLTFLGRGSVCINTAGEKVYPEEVEEVLKTHPDVQDALVVGVPDAKWGTAVTGVVALRRGAAFDEASLRTHVRARLAGYKTPKRILAAPRTFRAPNGKADYTGAADFAARELGIA